MSTARSVLGAAALWLTLVGCGKPAPVYVQNHMASAPAGSVAVVAFVDFECPYCREAHRRLHAAAQESGATLAIAYRHLPLRSHPHAIEAAAVHVCAEAQGQADAMADALYARGPEGHTSHALLQLSAEMGLDMTALGRCLSGQVVQKRLEADHKAFADGQFEGVPVMYVGEQLISGARSIDTYRAAIAQARRP